MYIFKEFYKTIVVDDLINVPDTESVWCELTNSKSRLFVGVCFYSIYIKRSVCAKRSNDSTKVRT